MTNSMMRVKKHLLYPLCTLLSGVAWAANPNVSATVDPAEGLIGDRFTITVKVDKDIMQVVDFPSFKEGKIAPGIELAVDYLPDTVEISGRRIILAKRYEITCFEAGNYRLGRFPVLYLDKNIVDTLHSVDSLSFVVNTFEIDTAKQTIYDIKPVETTPLVVGEVEGYLFAAVMLGLGIAAAVIMISYRIAGRRGRITRPEPVKEPADTVALRALDALRSQQLWQAGKTKQYYTALTDILRVYLGGRYEIDAMESTTDEILSMLDVQRSAHNEELARILRLADMVKFAKGQPTVQENEVVLEQAVAFVEASKEVKAAE